MPIILGVDPGIATTGYGIIEQNKGALKIITYGCIKTEAKIDFSERLKKIHQELKKIIEKYKPSAAGVEEIFFAKNSKTAIKVGEARGVILLTIIQAKIPVFEFTPLQIKQGLTNYGMASKKQVQKMVAKILNLETIIKSDDAADALAVAICSSRVFKIYPRPDYSFRNSKKYV